MLSDMVKTARTRVHGGIALLPTAAGGVDFRIPYFCRLYLMASLYYDMPLRHEVGCNMTGLCPSLGVSVCSSMRCRVLFWLRGPE